MTITRVSLLYLDFYWCWWWCGAWQSNKLGNEHSTQWQWVSWVTDKRALITDKALFSSLMIIIMTLMMMINTRTGGFDTIDVLHHNSVSANMCKSMESEFPTKIIGCKIPSFFFAIFNWAKCVGATKVSNYRTIILWL